MTAVQYRPLDRKGRRAEEGEVSTLEQNGPLVSRLVQHGLWVLGHMQMSVLRHQLI